MRKNIASFAKSTSFGMEEMGAEENEVNSQIQISDGMDIATVESDIQVLQNTQAALGSLHMGLLDLKESGKGLSLESAKFVQYYLSDVDNKLGGEKSVSLESYTSDTQRLDLALEGIGHKLQAVWLSNFTSLGWAVAKLVKAFEDNGAKGLALKSSLEKAIRQYEENGQSKEESITGNFGAALLKDDRSNPQNATIINNVKEYANKADSHDKFTAIKVITDSGKEIIDMIRGNWFFTSNKDNEKLKDIMHRLSAAIQDYSGSEKGTIGQKTYEVNIDESGDPSIRRLRLDKGETTFTFKPLSDKEFQEFSKHLLKLAEENIYTSKESVKILDKMGSVMGWSWVNGVFRVGPYITAAIAGFVVGNVLGAAAAVGAKFVASRVPSRDIYTASRYFLYASVVRHMLYYGMLERNKVIAEGTLLIKRSTA